MEKVFINNIESLTSSVIYVALNASIYLINNTFEIIKSNKAFILIDNNCYVFITNCYFKSIDIEFSGAIIYSIYNNTVTIENSTVKDNITTKNNGGICFFNSFSKGVFINVKILGIVKTISGKGGLFYSLLTNNNLFIKNLFVKFIDCYSGGGVIYSNLKTFAIIENISIGLIDEKSDNGGGMFLLLSENYLLINKINIKFVKSKNGGNIAYLKKKNWLKISEGIILSIEDSSKIKGGGILFCMLENFVSVIRFIIEIFQVFNNLLLVKNDNYVLFENCSFNKGKILISSENDFGIFLFESSNFILIKFIEFIDFLFGKKSLFELNKKNKILLIDCLVFSINNIKAVFFYIDNQNFVDIYKVDLIECNAFLSETGIFYFKNDNTIKIENLVMKNQEIYDFISFFEGNGIFNRLFLFKITFYNFKKQIIIKTYSSLYKTIRYVIFTNLLIENLIIEISSKFNSRFLQLINCIQSYVMIKNFLVNLLNIEKLTKEDLIYFKNSRVILKNGKFYLNFKEKSPLNHLISTENCNLFLKRISYVVKNSPLKFVYSNLTNIVIINSLFINNLLPQKNASLLKNNLNKFTILIQIILTKFQSKFGQIHLKNVERVLIIRSRFLFNKAFAGGGVFLLLNIKKLTTIK